MTQVTGTVDRIETKTGVSGSGKNWTAYNVVLTDGTKLGGGFKRPEVDAGTTYIFDVEGKFREIKNFRVTSGASAPAPASRGGGAPNNARDMSITRQNALGHAARLIAARGLPAGAENQFIAEQVIELADMLFAYSYGILDAQKEKAMAEAAEKADAPDSA